MKKLMRLFLLETSAFFGVDDRPASKCLATLRAPMTNLNRHAMFSPMYIF